MAPNQILVHRWGRRSRISVLFRRNFFLAFAKPFFCYQLFDNLGATKVNLDLKSE